MTAFSLAHLTAVTLSPPELIGLAARAGYDSVGLRLIRVTETTPGYPLMDDPALMRDTLAALEATGIGVLDVEFVRITPGLDPASLEPFMAAGARLGARHVITAPYDPELGRLADTLGRIGELAAGYGLRPVLEFFPWTEVPDLRTALRVVEAAGREEIGVLLDTLHFDRSGSTLAELEAAPAGRLPFLHLCDARVQASYTTEELFHAGRVERLPPGEGEIDLSPILRRMPDGIPVALEVPMTAATAEAGAEAVVRRALRAARRAVAAAAGSGHGAAGEERA